MALVWRRYFLLQSHPEPLASLVLPAEAGWHPGDRSLMEGPGWAGRWRSQSCKPVGLLDCVSQGGLPQIWEFAPWLQRGLAAGPRALTAPLGSLPCHKKGAFLVLSPVGMSLSWCPAQPHRVAQRFASPQLSSEPWCHHPIPPLVSPSQRDPQISTTTVLPTRRPRPDLPHSANTPRGPSHAFFS